MYRLGIISRADLTGLGVQSRNWVRLLNPDKVIVINSSPFNGNEQHFEWYSGRRGAFKIDGFIRPTEINQILDNIDVLLTFEIPYNYQLIAVARARGIKTIIQNNWEFTDYLSQPHLPLPDLLVNHSYWHLDEQKNRWPGITEYCPSPIFTDDFKDISTNNILRNSKLRFLHVAGRKTYQDRNGTNNLLEAIKLIPEEYDFELVIKAQSADIENIDDKRVLIDRSSPVDEKELYRDFDVMIMPRRYGGACLPMGEALMSNLPVIMPNIDPNNKILPKQWLIDSGRVGSFMTRTEIDIFDVDSQLLADKIIDFINMPQDDILKEKILARDIAIREFSDKSVLSKWNLLMQKLGV